MKIRYLKDIRRATKPPIPKGTIVSKTNEAAKALIEEGIAEEVKDGEVNENQPRSKDNPIEEVEEQEQEAEEKKTKKKKK